MKTICTITPLHSADIFIKAHFNMLSGVEKRVALIGTRPWPNYAQEHGITEGAKPEKILKKHFPDVEIKYTDSVIDSGNDMADFYNQFLDIAKEFDYVTRFDTDMLFTKSDWMKMIAFVKTHDYDFYRMNFAKNSINYYYDFEHGLKDGLEADVMIIKTNNRFSPILKPTGRNGCLLSWDGWMCHHFRGWNKPKSTGDINKPNKYLQDIKTKDWIKCPQEIREMFE